MSLKRFWLIPVRDIGCYRVVSYRSTPFWLHANKHVQDAPRRGINCRAVRNSIRNCSETVFNRAGIDTACRSRRIFLARTCLAFTGTRSLGLRVSEVSHRHRRGWIDRNGAWNLDADPRRPKESIVWRAVYRFLMMSLTASSQSRLIEKSGRDYIYIFFF